MTQQYPPQQQPYGYQPQKKRKVWPWVLLAVVMVPILGFVGCMALVGAGAKAVDDAREGGTVKLGESFTYKSGLGLAVSTPEPVDVNNEFIVAAGEKAYEVTVTVTNGTKDAVGASLITMNATVGGAPAEAIYLDGLPTQNIAPGQQLAIPFKFKVKKGQSGPVQVAVQDTFNEPVFFTGSL